MTEETPATSSVTSDAALLMRIQDGSAAAMAAFFDRYSQIVYAVAFRVLRDHVAAEQILQKLFLQIWREPQIASSRGSMAAWLALASRNRAIAHLRHRSPIPIEKDTLLQAPVTIAGDTRQRTLLARAHSAADQLPSDQRKVLEMICFDGLTGPEIATITGAPLNTVRTGIGTGLSTVGKAMLS